MAFKTVLLKRLKLTVLCYLQSSSGSHQKYIRDLQALEIRRKGLIFTRSLIKKFKLNIFLVVLENTMLENDFQIIFHYPSIQIKGNFLTRDRITGTEAEAKQ